MATYTKPLANVGTECAEIQLADHHVFHIDLRGGPLEIKSECGTLWVTVPNDPYDHVLKSGEHLAVNAKGRVVVQAITEACFSIN